MPRFVVLLRGVNVGKGNRVPMAAFKQLLEGLGHREVQTLLNSGNAVCTHSGRSAERHAVAIAAALQERLGVTTPVIVKTAAELASAVHGNPMVPLEADHSRFLVAFAQTPAALHALQALHSLVHEPARLAITADAAYLYCPAGLLQSKAAAALLGRLGKGLTTRNWATVLKLHQETTMPAAQAPVLAKKAFPKKTPAADAGKTPSQLIDARIAELQDWRGDMLALLRASICRADADILEEWKWNVPVWACQGILCTGETYAKAVKLTFPHGAVLPDPAGLFNASLEGKVRRAIDFPQGAVPDAAALEALIQAAVAFNRAVAIDKGKGRAVVGRS